MSEFPRRNNLCYQVKAERCISEAIDEVEKLGADERLTDAVVKLSEALDSLADYVDEQIK